MAGVRASAAEALSKQVRRAASARICRQASTWPTGVAGMAARAVRQSARSSRPETLFSLGARESPPLTDRMMTFIEKVYLWRSVLSIDRPADAAVATGS